MLNVLSSEALDEGAREFLGQLFFRQKAVRAFTSKR